MNREQLLAILWLRWRLTRNQFSRRGKVNAVLSVVLVGVAALGAVGMGIGGLLLGMFSTKSWPPIGALAVWDGIIFLFLLIWMTGLLTEIQRSETIDLTRLMHLPIRLRQVFVFNYLVSLATPSIILLLPGMLGLCVGMTIARGPLLGLSIPLVLGFVFLLTTWTYCLRGWLAALMVNKRRRRAIVMWITVGFIVVAQLPNLIVNSKLFRGSRKPALPPSTEVLTNSASSQVRSPDPKRDSGKPKVSPAAIQAHLYIPPGWVGYGTMRLAEGNPLPALGAIAASVLMGIAGLSRAYQITFKFYQGGEEAGRPVKRARAPVRGILLVERRVPWLRDDTAALALAALRSTLRAPELKMALILPIFLGAGAFTAVTSGAKGVGAWIVGSFVGSIAATLGVFSFAMFMANMFGFDRGGFRTLVLLPTPRHRILLARNLAILPFAAATSGVLLVLVKVLTRMSWAAFSASVLQIGIAFCVFALGCNWLAILAPYRIAPGTLQAKKPRAIVFVAAIITTLLMPVALVPVVIPAAAKAGFQAMNWAPYLPVDLIASAVVLALVVWAYRLLLFSQGRLFQRREQAILKEVTEEVE